METVTVDELEDMKCGVCFQNFSDETKHPCLLASAELYVTEENYVIPIEHLASFQKDTKIAVKEKASPGRHSSRIASKPKRRYNEMALMAVGINSSDSDEEIPERKKTKRRQRTLADDNDNDGGDDNENEEQEKSESSEERNALLAELDKDGGEMSEGEFRTLVLKSLRFMVSNMKPEKRNSRNDKVKVKTKKVQTMEGILKLEEDLSNTDFRSQWIEQYQEAIAPFITPQSDYKAIAKIILRTIFNPSALRTICFSGYVLKKFALRPRDEASNIFSALTEIFNLNGVHKYVKIKEGIQDTIYKSNDDMTRKLRVHQRAKKAS